MKLERKSAADRSNLSAAELKFATAFSVNFYFRPNNSSKDIS